MLLLTGASRMVGGSAIPALLEWGHPLRVLSSNQVSADKLRRSGVADVAIGNLLSAPDLDRALTGVDTVVFVVPSMREDDVDMGDAMIAAVKRNGVAHFVLLSCFHSIATEMRHHAGKLRMEQALIKSGLTYTILQPCMFMQTVDLFRQQLLDTNTFSWPWDPDKIYSMVDTRDLAAAIVAVVKDNRFRGGTYELVGEVLSGTDMARHLSRALGREIRATRANIEAWEQGFRGAGWTEWSIETFKGLCRYHDLYGYDGGNSLVLEMMIGRRPHSYSDFAAHLAGQVRSDVDGA